MVQEGLVEELRVGRLLGLGYDCRDGRRSKDGGRVGPFAVVPVELGEHHVLSRLQICQLNVMVCEIPLRTGLDESKLGRGARLVMFCHYYSTPRIASIFCGLAFPPRVLLSQSQSDQSCLAPLHLEVEHLPVLDVEVHHAEVVVGVIVDLAHVHHVEILHEILVQDEKGPIVGVLLVKAHPLLVRG